MYLKVIESLDELKIWLRHILPDIRFNKPYLCVIKVFRKKRSLDQNDLYWAWITAIANYIGDDKNSVHEAYKRKFLPWAKIELPGELGYYSPGHTPECNTQEFNKYLNDIHLHAYHFFDFVLPYPGDDGFNEFMMEYKTLGKAIDL